MKGLLARRPSPAMVVALVALVCALTGTAWAALGKNSVGTKQLKSNAVTGDVLLVGGGSDNYASLNGITFRAES